MYLWNDYEGEVLAGAFPLEKLLRTEGRSAFFSTRDRNGNPAIIRLTEALNDQEQLRSRYSAVKAVGQSNLVVIEAFGEAEVDGQPLFYLVMEPTQESLADIIRERRLSIEETNDVANAVVGAVEALHANGLVHGQVEPVNVLAAGEVIKLRSDCIRLAPEGADGARAFAADVRGVADVLNQSLTQSRLHDASDALALPEPYASIVRNVTRGSWGIEQVEAELRRFVKPPATIRPTPANVTSAPTKPPSTARTEAPSFEETLLAASRVADKAAAVGTPGAVAEANRPISSRAGIAARDEKDEPAAASNKRAATADRQEAQLPLVYAKGDGEHAKPAAGDWSSPNAERAGMAANPRIWIAGAAVLFLLLFLLWHLVGSNHAQPRPQTAAARVTRSAPTPAASAPANSTPAPVVSGTAKPSAATSASSPAQQAAAPGEQVWRVVAYTYNGENQAQSRVNIIAARHADVRPEVFTRNGQPPYLVTLGGPMTREQAVALRAHARKEGLAHDAYMQNYTH